MIPHNNEKDSLHRLCTYIHDGELCRLVEKEKYPKVTIRIKSGNTKEIDASTLFHISLTDSILDQLADGTEVSVTSPKKWIFDDKIPAFVYRSTHKGEYLYTNPIAINRDLQPFPVFTLDALQDIRHKVANNPDSLSLYARIKNRDSSLSSIKNFYR